MLPTTATVGQPWSCLNLSDCMACLWCHTCHMSLAFHWPQKRWPWMILILWWQTMWPERFIDWSQTLSQWSCYTPGTVTTSMGDSLWDGLWVGRHFQYVTSHLGQLSLPFLPVRRYASAGLCDSYVSVCPSVRPSHAGIVPSRAKAGSWNVHRLIAPWF